LAYDDYRSEESMKNSDREQLTNLLDAAQPNRELTPEEIDVAIQLARDNEAVDRYPGLLQVSQYLAATGGLKDLYKAIELSLESKDDPWARHFVLTILAERLIIADDSVRVYQVISQMENDATSVESGKDYWPAQKAMMWEAAADLYIRLGAEEKASFAIEKAIHLAIAGQFEENAQEANECQIVLRRIVGKLISKGRIATALKIIESTNWNDRTAWIDGLKIIMASHIRYQR
jgi:hypothetical protein